MGTIKPTQFVGAKKIAINFMPGTWDDIVQQAEEQNKFIFVDVYADYCPPCKQMDAQVFTDKDVAIFYNKNFINYKVNVSNRENQYFQTLHSIKELPALLYFTPEGRILTKVMGCKDVNEFLDLGSNIIYEESNTHLVANSDENIKFQQLYNLYENNPFTDTPILHDLAYGLKRMRRPYNDVVNRYLFANQRTARKQEVRQFVYDFAINLENQAIDYLLNDITYFKQFYGGSKINDKIKTAVYNSVLAAIQARNENLFKKAELTIKKANLPDEDRYLFEIRSIFYQGIEDWTRFSKVAYTFLSTQKSSDPQLLNDVAFKFQRYVTNKRMLHEAVKWSQKSIKMEYEYANHCTLALLLFKLNKPNQSLKVCKEAIEIAQRRGIVYTDVLKLMDMIHGSRF
jgi:thiol-disulfide isomerase/thioredoxin